MTKEIIISNEEINEREYKIDEKINGERFNLEKRINRYYKKTDGKKIINTLKDFLKLQDISYEKIYQDSRDAKLSLLLANCLSSKIAAELLNYENEERTSFFETKKIDYSEKFPTPVNDALKLYIKSMEESGIQPPLESITDAFFEWIGKDSYTELKDCTQENKIEEYTIEFRGKKHEVRKEDFLKEKDRKKSSFDIQEFISKKEDKTTKHISQDNSAKEPIKQKEQLNEDFIYGHTHVKSEINRLIKIVENRDYLASLFDPKILYKNYLLVGPPGTGKTTLIDSIAARCGIPVIKVPGVKLCSEFFSKSAANIQELYLSAKRMKEKENHAGVIILLDEFDQIAPSRKRDNLSHENNAMVSTLNDNLDGSSTSEGIITIATTNVEEMIDQAILTRFTKLYVGYPETKEEIIGIHKTIIKKIESYAQSKNGITKMFDSIDYTQILLFQERSDTYKSGRIINRILYTATIDKYLENIASGKPISLVTTEDIVKSYLLYEKEQEKKYDLGKIGLRTMIK